MSEQNKEKPGLAPRLRFPEFRNGDAWQLQVLGDIGETINGLSGKSAEDFGDGSPFITYKQIFENSFIDLDKCGLVRVEDGERQNEVAYRDILITGSSETPEEVGFASVVLEKPIEKTYLNSFCFAFRPNPLPLCTPTFSQFLFHSPWYRAGAVNLAQGSTRFNISKLGFLKLKLPIPNTHEQQKLADCLSSLDELIAAETQKLDAFEVFKKGLVQQLFPREGEGVPRLRFPEFRKAGAWAKVTAGQLFSNRIERGESRLPIYSVTMTEGLVPRASIGRRIEDIAESSANKKVCKGDIAYNMMRMWQGALGVAPEDCMVSPAYIVLKPKGGVNPVFYYFLLKQTETLQVLTAHSRGLTEDRLRLYYDDFAKVPLLCPSPSEQEKIAASLSSIDNLITVQNRKIDTLKTHKKGLMQQLFPMPNEVQR